MILHDYWRSSAAYRVRIALALKGIEPGRRHVHLGKGEQHAHWVAEGLAAIEKMLAARPGPGPFCLGAAPTMADVCLVPQVFNARRYKVPVEPYPLVLAVVDECMKLAAFDLAQPSRQPDAQG